MPNLHIQRIPALAILIGIGVGLVLLYLLQPSGSYHPLFKRPSYSDSVALAAPAVVNIYTRRRNSSNTLENANPSPRSVNLGSGVIVDKRGYILTNHHVVNDAEEIIVAISDGRQTGAKLIGTDPGTDLAVLKTNLSALPAMTLGKSSEIKVGDLALAIGNPFGLGQTVTMGIISATGRNSLGLSAYENFIQTDAAINPGNSGGALTDADGKLIGVSTAIYSSSGGSQGIGFAIPIDDALEIMQELIEHGEVARGYLGVEARQITSDVAKMLHLPVDNGLLISDVTNKSPAANSGLEVGDIIVSIDGHATINPLETRNLIASYRPGDTITLIGLRGSQSYQATIRLEHQPMR